MSQKFFWFAALWAVVSAQLEVSTEQGVVRGIALNGKGRAFPSIPYAEPPIGNLRWRAPKPKLGWEGVLDLARVPARKCIQTDIPPFTDPETGDKSEDCLTLTVVTPVDTVDESTKLRPVMVWIHGGAFILGSSHNLFYNLTDLAQFGNVVTVVLNYRLGALGFLAHAGLDGTNGEGNFGFEDQRLALTWVKENIAAFGGDPNKVTVFGESAGGMSVMYHLVSPLSRGLLQRAIAQSPTFFSVPRETLEQARKIRGRGIDRALGCERKDPKEAIACLRAKPAMEIEDKFHVSSKNILGPDDVNWVDFQPVFDGRNFAHADTLRTLAGIDKHVPLLVGATLNESSIFIKPWFPVLLTTEYYHGLIKDLFGKSADDILKYWSAERFGSNALAFTALHSAAFFHCHVLDIARARAKRNAETYVYGFNFVSPTDAGGMAAHHAIEVPYALRTIQPKRFTQVMDAVYHATDYSIRDKVSRLWVDFAYGRKLSDWPAFTTDSESALMLGGTGHDRLESVTDYFAHECELLSHVPGGAGSKVARIRSKVPEPLHQWALNQGVSKLFMLYLRRPMIFAGLMFGILSLVVSLSVWVCCKVVRSVRRKPKAA